MFNHLDQPEGNPYGPDHQAMEAAPRSSSAASERRAKWGSVLNGAILFTAMAVQAREWAKVRQGEELMAMASGRAGLDAALLSAIFGGDVPAVDMSNRLLVACFEAGKTATPDAVDQARQVVRANRGQREAAAQDRRDAERTQHEAKNRADRLVRTQNRANREAAKEQASHARAQREADEKVAYAAQKTAFNTAMASDPVSALVARWNGFEGAAAEVKTAAETAADELRAAGVVVETISAISGQWGRIKVLSGSRSVTIFADDLRQEPVLVRRARLLAEHLATGAILVDGVILTDDGREIAVEIL